MDIDTWDVLNARYRHSSDAQFLLFVDQLAEARALLSAATIPKQRMALVAIDNLAEVVLHRHKQAVERLDQEGWRYRLPRLNNAELRELKADFTARVRLGRRGGEDALLAPILRPVLDDLDDALFRTGHAYRNRLYHADHHNAAVLKLVAGGYAGAVGRAFVRLQPRNTAKSMSDALRTHLSEYGYNGSKGWGINLAFAPADAAESIVGDLVGDLEPSLDTAKPALIDDIRIRTDWADSMVGELLNEPGMTDERFTHALRWGEFWSTHGRDEQIVEHDRELAEVWNSRVEGDQGEDDTDSFTKINDLQEARSRRVAELLVGFVPTFDLNVIDQTRRLGRRLHTARNVGTLMIRYQKLDEALDSVEYILDDMAIGWDRHIQEEEARARGK